MRIHRYHPEDNFTIIPNATLQDERLSMVALGVLCQLISRPDGWSVNADSFWRQLKKHQGKKNGQGREAIRAAFAELEKYGYLVRQKTQGEYGHCITTLDLYNTPGHKAGESEASAWDIADEAARGGGPEDDSADRGTELRGTEFGVSEFGASENVVSIERTDTQRTDTQRTEDKDSSALADTRAADAVASARDREAKLKTLYNAVDRVPPTDLRNALVTFEKKRPRIFRDCRNDTLGQLDREDPSTTKGNDAALETDRLSYKYALQHYQPKRPGDDWPAWLMRPLADALRQESVRKAS